MEQSLASTQRHASRSRVSTTTISLARRAATELGIGRQPRKQPGRRRSAPLRNSARNAVRPRRMAETNSRQARTRIHATTKRPPQEKEKQIKKTPDPFSYRQPREQPGRRRSAPLRNSARNAVQTRRMAETNSRQARTAVHAAPKRPTKEKEKQIKKTPDPFSAPFPLPFPLPFSGPGPQQSLYDGR